jgi:hypothetical protein
MSDQDNVVNLGQRKPAAETEKIQAAATAINNPEVPDYMLNQMIDDEFPVITDTIQLPSKGTFYKNKQSTVKIKHLTAEDENILTSPDLIRNGKVLDVLLDNAIIDTSLTADDMLVGDRNAVLMYLRKEGYGDDYEVKINCPSCSEDFATIVKISDIESKDLDSQPDSNGEFFVDLPKSVVYSNLLTERFLLQIMEINGNRDKLQIKKAISNMPAIDSLFLREYVGNVEPGLKLESNYTCTNCSHNFDGDIPITPKLFWPNAKL